MNPGRYGRVRGFKDKKEEDCIEHLEMKRASAMRRAVAVC